MEKIITIISEVFELVPAEVKWPVKIRELERWDSFNHIGLIIAVENEFDISFEPSEVEAIHTSEDLLKFVNAKKH